jgi:transposase, IS30 family
MKKGPGRRPQSAQRQRFVELRSRGWSVMAAAREVGVSRTSGKNWSRGYKTYRPGQVTGFVPALERLAVRQINNRPRHVLGDRAPAVLFAALLASQSRPVLRR